MPVFVLHAVVCVCVCKAWHLTHDAYICVRVCILLKYSSLVSATHVQVIQANSERFLVEMNAEAVAKILFALEVIPERVKYDIDHSKSREDANGHLLTFLKEDANEEQALQVFKVASEERGYGRMKEFAASILSKLQQGTYHSSHDCGLWCCIVHDLIASCSPSSHLQYRLDCLLETLCQSVV